MSQPRLRISQPLHGAGFAGAAPIPLVASLSGAAGGLFFRWHSSLNRNATATHSELNTADHSAAVLNWSAPLAEFGSHVIVLSATDQDGTDPAAIKAVTRAAMTGGAPPEAPAPCVIHRLLANWRTPAGNGQNLSKAAATLEFEAPLRWAKLKTEADGTPALPPQWIDDGDYQSINGITMNLTLMPSGAPAGRRTASLDLPLAALGFFRADDKTWFRHHGALPAALGSDVGPYTLRLNVVGGGVTASAERTVVLLP